MNKLRRKVLSELKDKLSDLKDSLEQIKDDEEGYRDGIPENLQGSERYEKAEASSDNLCEAVSNLEDVITNIESAVE